MELWTAFLLGLIGSLHCAAMCGPLALALPINGNTRHSFVLGRLAYNFGRIFMYSVLGGICGLLGLTLALAGFQRWISLVAGAAILISLALSSSCALKIAPSVAVIWLKGRLVTLLQQRTLGSLLLLGALNGLLPCGLVYAACAGAVASSGVNAVGYMLVFGLGTLPMMLSVGLLGKKLHFALRFKLQRLIPVCLVLMGLLLIVRGLSLGIPYLSPDLAHADVKCPACH